MLKLSQLSQLSQLPRAPEIPSLRTLEDLHGTVDLERVVNLSKLYARGIDDSNDEHIARMGVFHPSAVGYCKLAQVLQYIRMPPTDRRSKAVLQIFEVGHLVHHMVQSRLARLGPQLAEAGLRYTFRQEVTYDPATDLLYREFGIGGTADGILSIGNDFFEQRGIVEIKSQNDERHKELLKAPTAYPSHLKQAHIYAWRFKLPLIWMFYINKNTSKREVRLHLFKEEIFASALDYFSECGSYAARGELPPREETWFECKECVYRTFCKPAVLKKKKNQALPASLLRRR